MTSTIKDGGRGDTLSIDDAIELVGMGKFQMRLLLASGLCFAADAMEILLLSFLSLVVQKEWGLTDTETSLITSSVFGGALLGSLVLGSLGDRIGRKPTFVLTASIIAFFGLVTALAQNYIQLLLVRFMVGFGVGGLLVPFDTLAEFVPTSHRAPMMLMVNIFWSFGTMLVPIFAYFTLGDGSGEAAGGEGVEPWRIFVLLCAIPCMIASALALIYVPESPRYLVANGQHEKAKEILQFAAVQNNKDHMMLFPQAVTIVDDTSSGGEEAKTSICDLLSMKWIRMSLALWGVWASFAMLYYGAIITTTLIFSNDESGGGGEGVTESENGYKFDYIAIFFSSVSEVIGITIVMFTTDKYGRVLTQIVLYTLAGIFLSSLCFLAQSGAERDTLMLFAFLARMSACSASATTWLATPEILPTEIRTTGHSVANAFARFGGAFAPFIASKSSPFSTIGISFLLIGLVGALCASFLPETAGRALGVMHHKNDATLTTATTPSEVSAITEMAKLENASII